MSLMHGGTFGNLLPQADSQREREKEREREIKHGDPLASSITLVQREKQPLTYLHKVAVEPLGKAKPTVETR